MTLHIRQSLPGTEIDTLVNAAFKKPVSQGIYRNHAKRAFDVVLVLAAAIPVRGCQSRLRICR